MSFNRAVRPTTSREIKFSPPAFTRLILDNGIKVLFTPRSSLPIIRMNFVTGSGSKFDPVDKKGLSNLFSMMLDEGAGKYSGLDLSDEFELLGSNFETSTSNDTTLLTVRSLSENFEKTLDLFHTIASDPHLNEIDFDREKRKLLVRLIQLQDSVEYIAGHSLEYILFNKKHPYAFPVLGYTETVENIQLPDLRNFYENYFLQEDCAIVVSGDIDKNDLFNLLNSTFGKWNTLTETKVMNAKPPMANAQKLFFIHKEGAVQSEIRVAHLTDKRNESIYLQKLILNMVLGGQFSSRINLNLREDKGYTYGAFSNFYYFREGGYFSVSTSVNSENTAGAIREIFKELNEIKTGIKPSELKFALSSLVRKFPSNFENNKQITSSLLRILLYNLDDNHFHTYIDRANAITLDDVNMVAKDYIKPEEAFVIVVGDRRLLQTQLKELGFLDVVELDINGEDTI